MYIIASLKHALPPPPQGSIRSKKNLNNNPVIKNCNLFVYLEADGVSKYTLSADIKTIRVKEKEVYHFFNAFFYSKVKLGSTYEIKNN
jgi:hypothetical protein